MAGPAYKTLKLSLASCYYAPLLLLLLLTLATAHAAATQSSPPAPPAPSPSSSDESYDTAGNPDYYTFDLGTTLSETAGEIFVVCVSTWAPFVSYNSTTNTLKGYEWDLFVDVSKAMGLSFEARVMGWNEMMNSLALDRSNPNHCDIAPSAIAMTPERMTTPKKLQFSVPTYHSGYGIATLVTSVAEYDMWSFGRVFTVELWGVLLATSAVLALLTYAAEHDYAKRGLGKTKYPTAFRPGMYEAVYNCVGKLFNVVQDLKVTSLSGKLISMGWGFLVLVAGTTYTAGVTATLTSANFKTTIVDVRDLTHYRVVTYTPVDRVFLKFGFQAKAMPWVTDADGAAMLDMVTKGAADALVIDYPWLQSALATRCSLALVGQPFHYIDNAVGFNVNLPQSFINEYNFHLMNLKQDGMYEEYRNKYLKPNECPSRVNDQQLVVTFKQLKGLWVILGAFVALAIILLILPRISSRFEADSKRNSSVFRLGKSIAKLAARSRSGTGMPKGAELQRSPFAQGMGVKVVPFTSTSTCNSNPNSNSQSNSNSNSDSQSNSNSNSNSQSNSNPNSNSQSNSNSNSNSNSQSNSNSNSNLQSNSNSNSQCRLSLPGEVPEPPRASVGSVARKGGGQGGEKEPVVPFSSDDGSAGADLQIHIHACASTATMLSHCISVKPSDEPRERLPSPKVIPKTSKLLPALEA